MVSPSLPTVKLGAAIIDAMATARDPERTRTRILDAAAHEFVQRGFDGVSLGDIARRARASKQLILHHFASKEGLFHAVLDIKFRAALDAADPRARRSFGDHRGALPAAVQPPRLHTLPDLGSGKRPDERHTGARHPAATDRGIRRSHPRAAGGGETAGGARSRTATAGDTVADDLSNGVRADHAARYRPRADGPGISARMAGLSGGSGAAVVRREAGCERRRAPEVRLTPSGSARRESIRSSERPSTP